MAAPRPFLQFKANLTDGILDGGGTCSTGDRPGAVELPPGRLTLRLTGEVQGASPLLAWLGQGRVAGRLIVNTETGALFLQLELET